MKFNTSLNNAAKANEAAEQRELVRIAQTEGVRPDTIEKVREEALFWWKFVLWCHGKNE